MYKNEPKEQKRIELREYVKHFRNIREFSEFIGVSRDTVKKWSCGLVEIPDPRIYFLRGFLVEQGKLKQQEIEAIRKIAKERVAGIRKETA